MSFNYKPTYYARRPQIYYGRMPYQNQLGALTPDSIIRPPTPVFSSGSGGGLVTTGSYTPPFVPTAPPAFPTFGNSTVQQISNTVTGQLKFDQIAALISQGIAAWGKNPSQQISGLTVRPVQTAQPGYTAGLTTEQYNAQMAAIALSSRNNNGAGQNAFNGVTGLFDGLAQSFGISSTTLFIGAGVCIYLLLREPPRSRR